MTTATDSYYANHSALCDWGHLADAAMRQLIRAGKPFTADDFNALMEPTGVEPTSRNAVGATFSVYRNRELIKPIGYTISTTPKRNGGVIRVWIGA